MHVFVRWKRKEAFHHSIDYDGTYYTEMACLVRSERTPEGPRQRVVCFLGGIRCYLDRRAWKELKIGWYTKHEFWGRTLAALDRAGIDGDDRAGVLAELEWVNPNSHDRDDEVKRRQKYARRFCHVGKLISQYCIDGIEPEPPIDLEIVAQLYPEWAPMIERSCSGVLSVAIGTPQRNGRVAGPGARGGGVHPRGPYSPGIGDTVPDPAPSRAGPALAVAGPPGSRTRDQPPDAGDAS